MSHDFLHNTDLTRSAVQQMTLRDTMKAMPQYSHTQFSTPDDITFSCVLIGGERGGVWLYVSAYQRIFFCVLIGGERGGAQRGGASRGGVAVSVCQCILTHFFFCVLIGGDRGEVQRGGTSRGGVAVSVCGYILTLFFFCALIAGKRGGV